MFTLFFSLYMAMLRGRWTEFSNVDIKDILEQPLNGIGQFITSIFSGTTTPYADFGSNITNAYGLGVPAFYGIVAFILALITSIGIVVMAVKGIKRVFGVFFMGIRNI